MKIGRGWRRVVASVAAMSAGAALVLVPSSGAAAEGVTGFELVALHSGKALDVAGGAHDDGAGVIQWTANGGENQRWVPLPFGDAFVFVNVSSGRVLDVSGASVEAGAPVVQWEWNGGENQIWRLFPVGPDASVFINVGSGKALDVSAGSVDDGAGVIQWDWGGGANQLWQGVSVNTIAAPED